VVKSTPTLTVAEHFNSVGLAVRLAALAALEERGQGESMPSAANLTATPEL